MHQLVGLWALLLLCTRGANSMPITDQGESSAALTTQLPTHETDYIRDEQEFARILQQSASDYENSMRKPANFVSDDLSDEEIMRMFQRLDGETPKESDAITQSSGDRTEGDVTDPSRGQAEQVARQTTTMDPLHHANQPNAPVDESQTESTVMSPGNQIDRIERDELITAMDTTANPSETNETQEPTTTTLDPLLYAESDEDFELLLKSIKEELLERKIHPANYVSDDNELEYILSRLEDDENVIEARLARWERDEPLVYEANECPICREEMGLGGDHKFECNHEFHVKCIQQNIQATTVSSSGSNR